ncbi:PREDICTED: uncharacterized protein LOC109478917 [Branchiostoma belcheri]|uniref:Uncharacterized protein LOC109478917 n=1 Tax=Branchiostoma belcheri TaxID=7741 RepID=A0A6P4ZHP0_BRABE|nr:PREDICTED: uncharacterized protein LOC109478917 [Branchiostoma belcheri]
MKVSSMSLLFTLGFLWTRCFCLPENCEVNNVMSTSLVDCTKLGLVTVPSDIPSTTVRFDISFNNIRNVTYLPPLPKLYTLDLSYNSIESVSWMSLRTLPALAILELQGNQLKYVKLDIVIAHLPKLKSVNLSMNKLASFSSYALGWPQVTEVLIYNNPFHCDCDLSWLIVKMACLQACKGKDGQTCCSSCMACFLHIRLPGYENIIFDCKSPSQLRGRHFSTVSTQLTDCGTTHQAETKLQSTESVTFLTNGSIKNNIQSPFVTKEPSLIVPPIGNTLYNETVAEGSNSRQPGAHQPPIQLDQIVPPIANISYNETVAGGSNPRQPIAHQITSPIVNSSHQCTSTRGLHGGHLGTSGENQNTPSVENYENYSTEGQEHLYENDDDDGKHENHPAEGHVAGQTNLTCYKCQALHGDDDFYTCLQNPFSSSVERENCTDDKDTCQATVLNSDSFYVVRRRCATALDCEEAQNGTTPEYGQCCQNNTCNDRLFDVTTTPPPTTTVRTTTLPLTTAILVTTSTSSSLTTQAEGQTGGMSAGVIAGCSVAGVAVLLMAAGAIYYIKHRKEKQDSVTAL